jgi:hypothetical protein
MFATAARALDAHMWWCAGSGAVVSTPSAHSLCRGQLSKCLHVERHWPNTRAGYRAHSGAANTRGSHGQMQEVRFTCVLRKQLSCGTLSAGPRASSRGALLTACTSSHPTREINEVRSSQMFSEL